MFECGTCHKSYATQSSLTRHAHNHESGRRHTCAVCDISFRRRDLLARHEKIHDTGHDDVEGERRRCHTACEACRKNRVKCDGQQPCGSCSRTQSTCSFQRPARRISRKAHQELSSDDGDDESGGQRLTEHHGNAGYAHGQAGELQVSPMLLGTNTFAAEQSSMTQGSLEAGSLGQIQPSLEDHEFANILASMHHATDAELESVPELWPPTINWPWAHEQLYLRDGPDYGPYGVADLDGLQLSVDSMASQHVDMIGAGNATEQGSGGNTIDESLLAISPISMTPTRVIDSIVREAVEVARDNSRWAEFWNSASNQISVAFNISAAPEVPQGVNVLEHFSNIYLEQFQPLWPLLWQPGLELDKLHPLLLLTITSIGALYSGVTSSRYGSLLHEKMREVLLVSPPRTDQTDQENLDLGRAMLLTQVAAIYFEQQHAFSAAQRLGALLNAHAQKMRLFSYRSRRGMPTPLDLTQANNVSAIQWHKQWVFAEGCKRLAYGVVRGEVFMSVLLDSKPLASYEEVDLELPYSDTLWTTKRQFAREYISAVGREHSLCRGMIFSDLVRVALDPNEVLPLLQPLEHELLLYGLQYSVWRFSHDPSMFKRLTGHDATKESAPTTSDFESAGLDHDHLVDRDHLDYSTRKMRDLLRERQNVICALRKWKDMVASSQMSNQYGHNRTTYLSGLMLFHLSFLRLHAPVGLIQEVVYHNGSPSEAVKVSIQTIADWSRTNEALVAIKHACSMWTLIEKETSRKALPQARYTILTVIAVYQAATVIWAMAGACDTSRHSLNMMGSSKQIDKDKVELSKSNISNLMQSFAELFPDMTSTWGTQSSFSKMVLELATRTLI
ncbi:hypothetical protein AUEXF2481DRAFT_535555 [Aureobasidium subglaciale EXF-2481]|uniref:Zn(2)-C6 fungal-type domain-containing protein n=1 Tax=Aureobasidium subglaciale (strain EXF-2481) TaxID=1043005 RepID=A0A074Y8P4_AURSE|nr:uncharacterized protein AUEXF2481DRAFT_535555 [Aureobasidium subglaciale EXF-2481]KEQ90582.1 hypothetical protein AUEXF2481DRAFT_535555 [Aureobasidium subglaciale EXF-2481]